MRTPALDALRGVAILAVVGLHASFETLLKTTWPHPVSTPLLAIHLLTGFGVPLFVALSMASLSLRYPGTMGIDRDYGRFLRRRAVRVLPAYVAWSLLTLARTDLARLTHPTTVAWTLLLGTAAAHFYFVPMVFQLYLLWPPLSRLGRAARRGAGAAAAVAAGGVALMLVAWKLAPRGLLPYVTATSPLLWIGYAVVGLAVAQAPRPPEGSRGGWWRGAALLVFALAAAAQVRTVAATLVPTYDYLRLLIAITVFRPLALLYALAAMALALAVVTAAPASRPVRGLAALGRRSYGVYLTHMLVLELVVYRLLGRPAGADLASAAWLVKLALSWALAVALSDALVRLLAAVPILRTVSGVAGGERR
jgi:peptidoglycan/LPS O-acetylase OafA/YrhL